MKQMVLRSGIQLCLACIISLMGWSTSFAADADVDRTWMIEQEKAINQAVEAKDEAKARSMLGTVLKSSAGTAQEPYGLLVSARTHLNLGDMRPIPRLVEQVLAAEPVLFAATYADASQYLSDTVDAIKERDVVGAVALQRTRAAIIGHFHPEKPEWQEQIFSSAFVMAARSEEYSLAADVLERVRLVRPSPGDDFKQALFDFAPILSDYAELRDDVGQSQSERLGAARTVALLAELVDAPMRVRAKTMRTFGSALESVGRWKESELRYQEALLLAPTESDSGDAAKLQSSIWFDLARLASYRDDWQAADRAMNRSNEALAASNDGANESAFERIDRLVMSGQIHRGSEKFQQALALFNQAEALVTAQISSGDDDAGLRKLATIIATERGLIQIDLGDNDAAIDAAAAAMSSAETLLETTDRSLPIILYNIADVMAAAGQLDRAVDIMRTGFDEARSRLPDMDISRAELASGLAQALELQGNRAEAKERLDEALAIMKDPFNRSRLQAANLPFSFAALQAFERGDHAATFEAIQWTQVTDASRALESMAQRMGSSDPQLSKDLRRRQDLATTIDRSFRNLNHAEGKSTPDSTMEPMRNTLAQARAALVTLDRRLADTGNKMLGLGQFTPIKLADAQARLKPDEVLVTFVVSGLKANLFGRQTSSSNFVLAITADQVVAKPIAKASRKALVAEAGYFRCAVAIGCLNGPSATTIADGGSSTDVATRGNLLAADPGSIDLSDTDKLDDSIRKGADLYSDLLGPVDAIIADKAHLIIAPPSDFLGLPYAALVTGKIAGQDGVPWLIRRQAISVLPSVSALSSLHEAAQRYDDSGPKLLGIGDPLIGGRRDATAFCNNEVAALRSAPRVEGDAIISNYEVDAAIGFALADSKMIAALPALPDAECELQALSEAFSSRGAESQILLRGQANESAVKALSRDGLLAGFDTLVFATHGLVRGEAGATEPALVLTPPDKSDGHDDGLLTAGEIAALRLDADLVVLSACNTAAGADTKAEGLSGLARAFFHAGARSLMVTHWSVYSSAAAEISPLMFENRARQPNLRHAEALRLAMIDVMDDPRGGIRSQPAYWAAFAIVGL